MGDGGGYSGLQFVCCVAFWVNRDLKQDHLAKGLLLLLLFFGVVVEERVLRFTFCISKKGGGLFFVLPSTSLWGFYLLTCIHPGFPMHTYCIAFWFTFCVVALQRPRARSRGAPTLTLEQIAPVLQWAPHCPLLRGGASSHFSLHEAASLVPQTHRLVTRSVHVILHDWRGSAGARSALC